MSQASNGFRRHIADTFEDEAKTGSLMLTRSQVQEKTKIGRDILNQTLGALVAEGVLGASKKGNRTYYYLRRIVDGLEGTSRML